MTDLDPRARAIVEAGRQGDLPSRADHDRIKRAVLLQVAAGTAVAGTAAAGTLSLGAKAGVAVLAVVLVGGGAVGVLKLREGGAGLPARAQVTPGARVRPATVAPALPPAAPAAEEALATPGPAGKTVGVRKAEPARKVLGASDQAVKAAEMDHLNAEVEVLKRAREELRQRRPARALAALAEYDRRFGKGVLAQERQAMAAIAACQATPGPAAREQADAFVRQAPASPLRERVREACITPPLGSEP